MTPDRNALCDDFLDTHALKVKNQLEELGVVICYKTTAGYVSDTKLNIEKNIENIKFLYLNPICLKSYNEELILRTDKGKYFPTYRLKNNEDPYLSEHITFWKDDYAAVNRLRLSSYKKLEPIITKQLANLDSDIFIQGRKLSNRIGNVVRKEVFYPIAELISGTSNKYIRLNPLQCPSCSQNWNLKTMFCKIFDFKCNKCLLLGYELIVYED